MVLKRMIKQLKFTKKHVQEYFTLPNGEQDFQMVEILNDLLEIKIEYKNIKVKPTSAIYFRGLQNFSNSVLGSIL